MTDPRLERRRYLLAMGAVGLGSLAGCSSIVPEEVSELAPVEGVGSDSNDSDSGSDREGESEGASQGSSDGETDFDGEPIDSFEARVAGPGIEPQQLFDERDVTQVGSVQEQNGSYQVPIQLSEEGTEVTTSRLNEVGALQDSEEFVIQIVVDGEVEEELRLAPGLADAIAAGEWQGQFHMVFAEPGQAERIQAHLAGR